MASFANSRTARRSGGRDFRDSRSVVVRRCVGRIDALELILRVFLAFQAIVVLFVFESSSVHWHLSEGSTARFHSEDGRNARRDPAGVQRAKKALRSANPNGESFADARRRHVVALIRRLGKTNRTEIRPPVRHAAAAQASTVFRVLEEQVSDIMAGNTTAMGSTGEGLTSCFDYRGNGTGPAGSARVFLRDGCRGESISSGKNNLIVFNPHDRARSFCGRTVSAFGAVEFRAEQMQSGEHHASFLKCFAALNDTGGVLSLPPPSIFYPEEDQTIDVVLSEKIAPVKKKGPWKLCDMASNEGTYPMRDVLCDVPCRWPDKAVGVTRDFQINGTDWIIRRAMEPTHYYAELGVHPAAYKDDLYYMTHSFRSDLPIPYFSWIDFNIKTEPVDFDNVLPGATFIAANCKSGNAREKYVLGLQQHIKIYSLGGCMKSDNPPKGVRLGGYNDYPGKVAVMSKYRFHLAFENGNEEEYVTEKIWLALEAGVVPIYLGAPDIRKHAPPDSFIFANDFPSIDALGEYVKKVNENRTLYDQFHEWRKRDYPEFMVKKFGITTTHGECRACRWAHAKKRGLSWDHDAQNITAPAMMSPLGVDAATGMVTRPFKETWQIEGAKIPRSSAHLGAPVKYEDTMISELTLDPYIIRRSLYEHDNVIDMTVQVQVAGDMLLNTPVSILVETGIKGVRFFHAEKWLNSTMRLNSKMTNYAFMQNNVTRFSLFADWNTVITNVRDDVIQILIYDGLRSILDDEVVASRRLRFIFEDHNKLHYNGTDTDLSYFANGAMEEFHRPLEYFYFN
uniref:Fucosyltransferase n=1 Tax=Odontella aurita TaxID=265563 RepID=A0A7S4N8Y4_9STRA|mmetsp:Transcript_52685/g.157813  ORF Transcript_52685/g.157813 Transcript_52685/m.157813 type:complete len:793 (+) Transcript_52685:104-2482(+)